MISPLTLAMMRSRISAERCGPERSSRLGRRITCRRSMVHLGSGQELGHELACAPVRFLTGQKAPNAPLDVLEGRAAAFLPCLHPQDMIPEAGFHDVARSADREGERRAFQLGEHTSELHPPLHLASPLPLENKKPSHAPPPPHLRPLLRPPPTQSAYAHQ